MMGKCKLQLQNEFSDKLNIPKDKSMKCENSLKFNDGEATCITENLYATDLKLISMNMLCI